MKTKIFLVIVVFFFSVIFSICAGTEFFSLKSLFSPILLSDVEKTILFKIRIPRVLTALVIGGGLSISGVMYQAILKNPLAESYTLGISGGASLGICLGVILSRISIIPLFAFAGSLISISIVFLAGRFKRFSNTTLILLGVVLNFIFSSFVLLLLSVFKNEKFLQTFIWLIGDLSSTPISLAKILSPLIFLFSFFSIFYHRTLDVLSIGEEKALTLGIDVEKEKKLILFISSLISSLCVSLSGIIGFVGLIVPHMVRILFGSIHKYLLILSFIVGSSFLMLSDCLSRLIIKPLELPVGVITGFFGGLFFLFLLFKGEKIW